MNNKIRKRELKCLFVHDFVHTKHEGRVYGEGQFSYDALWKKKYLPFFSQITVLSRGYIDKDKKGIINKHLLSGTGVDFVSTPSVSSLTGLLNLGKVWGVIKREIENSDFVIVRLPSMQGLLTCSILRKSEREKPYVIEVVGDAGKALWYHGRASGKFLALPVHLLTKKYIKQADNVVYVTNNFLQKKYPNDRNTLGCSDVVIDKNNRVDVLEPSKKIDKRQQERLSFKIGLVGSYDVSYKGHDVAIKALSRLDRNTSLHFLGSGSSDRWRKLSVKYGVEKQVFFDNPVNSGESMEKWLDDLDVLIVPSKTEGMPRVLLEGMARGLPVVATRVGEIPYLLATEYTINANDWVDLADKLKDMMEDRSLMIRSAKSNQIKSQSFALEILEGKRKEFIDNIISKEFS